MDISAPSTTPNGGSESSAQQSTCQVMFFRVFDLADFFNDPDPSASNNRSIRRSREPVSADPGCADKWPSTHFLEKRTAELSRSLFSYRVAGSKIKPVCEEDRWSEDPQLKRSENWKNSRNDKQREAQAYANGWVRGTLLKRFFAPAYEYRKEDANGNKRRLSGIIPTEDSIRPFCDIYRNWIQSEGSLLDDADIFLTISPYGMVSITLEIKVPIDKQLGEKKGAEFLDTQAKVSPFFYSSAAEGLLKGADYEAADYPSLLSFISLSAIWTFLCELEQHVQPSNESLQDWWKDSIDPKLDLKLKTFREIWEHCIDRPFPLRHEAAYYYFEHDRYQQKSSVVVPNEPGSSVETQKEKKVPKAEDAPTQADLDCIIRLGLLVSPDETSPVQPQELFSKDIRRKLDRKDLCVTDNGYAFVVGSSLIVAAKKEAYRIQGSKVDECAYWRWMFRLLCCLRECFMLCDIGSRDVRRLRERYEAVRNQCLEHGNEAKSDKLEDFEDGSRKLLGKL